MSDEVGEGVGVGVAEPEVLQGEPAERPERARAAADELREPRAVAEHELRRRIPRAAEVAPLREELELDGAPALRLPLRAASPTSLPTRRSRSYLVRIIDRKSVV